MSVQIITKTDLLNTIDRWINDVQFTPVARLEVITKQDMLIIKKAPHRRRISKSAVLETQGTIHLTPETIHEIALSRELLYDE